MSKFRCEYTYNKRFGSPKHCWICIGPKGATHLHISGPHGDFGYSAGLEAHYRTPPEYMADQAPSHDDCWVLKAPCWHDGTSLYASEVALPLWLSNPHDHDGIFAWLEREYASRFEGREP